MEVQIKIQLTSSSMSTSIQALPIMQARAAGRHKPTVGPSQAEILLHVTSLIAIELVKTQDANQTVSLNELHTNVPKKHGYSDVLHLINIVSVILNKYKKTLLPKLHA